MKYKVKDLKKINEVTNVNISRIVYEFNDDTIVLQVTSRGNESQFLLLDRVVYDTRKEEVMTVVVDLGNKNPMARVSRKYKGISLVKLVLGVYNLNRVIDGKTSYKNSNSLDLRRENIEWKPNNMTSVVYHEMITLTDFPLLYIKKPDRVNGYTVYYHQIDKEDVLVTMFNKSTNVVVQTLIDTDTYPTIKDLRLIPRKSNTSDDYYICQNDDNGYGKLHRLVLKLDHNNRLQADHINRDTRDNRRRNLRAVTPSVNMLNRGISKNNTTGVSGVSYGVDRGGIYTGSIIVQGKKSSMSFSVNVYGTKEAFRLACEWRDKKEQENKCDKYATA